MLTSKSAQKFRSTVVKFYILDAIVETPRSLWESFQRQTPPFTNNHSADSSGYTRFETSPMKEFSGPLERVVFTLVPASEAAGLRIYGSRFFDSIKHEGEPQAYEKSRRVV